MSEPTAGAGKCERCGQRTPYLYDPENPSMFQDELPEGICADCHHKRYSMLRARREWLENEAL